MPANRDGVNVNLDGLEDAINALRAKGPQGDAIVSREIIETAKEVQREARAASPEGDTGRLKRSIAAADSEERMAEIANAAWRGSVGAPVEIPEGSLRAWVGTSLFYAHIIHWGSRFHPPRPFLVPALEMQRPLLLERLRVALKELNNP